jgi:outer membrane protein assembly factor BamE (lipoprotein component of BamABCDE complex)
MNSSLSQVLAASVIVASVFFAGCASSNKAPQKSNLSFGTIKSSIVKGKTSQSEVVQLLGSPNIVTKNKDNEEVWTYSRQSTDSEEGGFGGGLLVFGGNKAFSSQSSNSFDLIITFNSKDIVRDYSVVQAQF